MKNTEIRKRLFTLFSENLKNVLELTGYKIAIKENNSYLHLVEPALFCPLCLVLFKERSLYINYSDRLTIEHVPQATLGGKRKLLTCKKCNEKAGENLDHHILRDLKIEPFLKAKEGSKIEARFTLNKIPFKSNVQINNGHIYIDPNTDKKMSTQLSQSFNDMKNTWNGSKFHLRFYGGNDKKSKLALLKSAYLEMFSTFGHLFLFNNNSKMISDQLKNPLLDIIPHSSILDQEFDSKFEGVHLITSPKEFRCFLVVLKLYEPTNKYKKVVGVLIPGPDEEAWANYNNFKHLEKTEFSLKFFTKIDCIRNKENTLAYHDIWYNT